MAVRSYDPDRVSAIVGGVVLTQFGPDDMISVAYNEDAVTLQVGADGEAAISRNRNRSGRFTFTLMQTSEANDQLMAVVAAFEVGKILVPIIVKDLEGRSLAACEKAWCVKVPDVTYGKEAGTVEWIFETDTLVSFVGGNTII